MSTVLELIDVVKSYRPYWSLHSVRAVDGLSLALADGEIFGLIGHNGAGKTTTFKLLVGLLRPTRGTLLWCGERLNWCAPRYGIGFSPEQPYFYDYLTVRETLQLYGQLYGLPGNDRRRRIDELAAMLGIDHNLDAPLRALSKGTVQRVAIAQAIIHNPRLAILDEPMSGLDPGGRRQMRDLIAGLKRQGTTVLFSSHILSDAEALCDRVGILVQGRLREIVSLGKDNTVEAAAYTLTVTATNWRGVRALEILGAQPAPARPDRWTIKLPDQAAVQAALVQLHGTGARLEALVPQYPSLEQRFLHHVGNGSDAD
jgi:ABC-2 type transport system ATP-binding protein